MVGNGLPCVRVADAVGYHPCEFYVAPKCR